jgi:hypothetical protein
MKKVRGMRAFFILFPDQFLYVPVFCQFLDFLLASLLISYQFIYHF